jgi:hypothetical protein
MDMKGKKNYNMKTIMDIPLFALDKKTQLLFWQECFEESWLPRVYVNTQSICL